MTRTLIPLILFAAAIIMVASYLNDYRAAIDACAKPGIDIISCLEKEAP